MGFGTIDYVILAVYLVGVAVLGIVRGGKQTSSRDYFLGSDGIPWWVVCFSIVAAETSTLTFISIPGIAYFANLNFLQVTFGYLLGRIIISFIFLPAYYKGELSTAYAFLETRFGTKTRTFASLVFLFTRLAAEGVRLFAAAIPLKFILNIDYPTAILIIAAVALLYTTIGGVRGVLWVDALQMVIYLGGAILSAILLVSAADGGWAGITQKAMEAGKFQIINLGFGSKFWGTPYTLLGGLLGGAFLSMASHGTDQLIVQRLLTTKSLAASRKALIGSGVIIIFQFALFLTVGILLYGHYNGATLDQMGLLRPDDLPSLYYPGVALRRRRIRDCRIDGRCPLDAGRINDVDGLVDCHGSLQTVFWKKHEPRKGAQAFPNCYCWMDGAPRWVGPVLYAYHPNGDRAGPQHRLVYVWWPPRDVLAWRSF